MIFGENNNKLNECEIIRETNNTLLLHIASKRRIEELLTIIGQCGAAFEIDDVVYCCAGKLFMNANNKHVVGYIVDETRCNWIVKLDCSSSNISIKKLELNKTTQQYTVDSAQNNTKIGRTRYKVKEYHPIRILISKTRCAWKITLNCLVLDENNNIVTMM